VLSKETIGRPRYRWEGNIKMNLKQVVKMWVGFMLFRIGSSGGLLGTQEWTFEFHSRQEISQLVE
jgi:hypothetical protein